jgi:hypothetical protein
VNTVILAAAQQPTTWPDVALAIVVFAGIALVVYIMSRWS